MTSDVRWDDVREWFDPETNGRLPDLCVRDTTIADWQGLLALIRAQGWAVEYSEDGTILRLPDRAEALLERRYEAHVLLKVWPAPEVEVQFFPYAAEEIDGAVDLEELQGQERLDLLCGFLRDVGRALGKPVWMTPEGDLDEPRLEYRVEADQVVLLAAPLR